MKKGLTVSLAALVVSLAPAALYAQQPATSAERQALNEPQVVLAKAREVVKRLQALTPEQAKQMPEAEALELFRNSQDVVLALTHVAYREVAMAQGQQMNEAGFRSFLAANGVEALMAEENLKKLDWLSARLSAHEVESVELDLRAATRHTTPTSGEPSCPACSRA
jgi:hypothetical protein